MGPLARWVAFTLVLVLVAVNFAVSRPIAVTLPHKSWDLVTPWPVQIARAHSLKPAWHNDPTRTFERMLIGMGMGLLLGRVANNAQRTIESVARAIERVIERPRGRERRER